MIEKIRQTVKADAREEDFHLHTENVVKYAKQLAAIKGVDVETVEIAALLHDIGRYRFGGTDHNITGVAEAEKVLRELGASDSLVEEIKHCVLTHGIDTVHVPKTVVAEIIRNADALTHFDTIPYLLKVGLRKFDNDTRKALEWVGKKVDDGWNIKLTIPEARELAKEKYKAAKLLIETNLSLCA